MNQNACLNSIYKTFMSIFYNEIVRTRVFKASLNVLIATHRKT